MDPNVAAILRGARRCRKHLATKSRERHATKKGLEDSLYKVVVVTKATRNAFPPVSVVPTL